MAGSTKGYRISAQDMVSARACLSAEAQPAPTHPLSLQEASRLVFVSVKDAKPKR